MIHLYPDSIKSLKSKREYFNRIKPLILDRINKVTNAEAVCFIDLVIKPNIKEILIGSPNEINLINRRYYSRVQQPAIRESIEYIFNYDWFIEKTVNRYSAYHLAENLQVEVCPYCNRNYTNTVITRNGEKIIRPQFDHFFDKKTNPLLALSFFNLIPSCPICNSNIKHGKHFNIEEYIHPYIDNEIDTFTFSFKYDHQSSSGLKIIINPTGNPKIDKTFNDMHLQDVYNAHTWELKDILDLKYKFSDNYLSILSSKILNHKISQSELYRLAFGVELESKDFGKRPFSKFKNDILRELEII